VRHSKPQINNEEKKMADQVIRIDTPEWAVLSVPIKGTAPLICNNFSEFAKSQLRESNAAKKGGQKAVKAAQTPEEQYQGALYRMFFDDGEGYGFPAAGFQESTKSAARFYGNNVTMVAVGQMVMMLGTVTKADPLPLIRVHGQPEMREDRIGTSTGGSQLTYRAIFPEWTADLRVRYVTTKFHRDTVLSLIDAGGTGVGVGCWRPENGGHFGTYGIDRELGVAEVPL